MIFNDTNTEWRIRVVERKCNEALALTHNIYETQRHVDSLERSLWEARSEIAELRFALQELSERILTLELGRHHD